MLHFKAKMHQIRFRVSVGFVCLPVQVEFDTYCCVGHMIIMSCVLSIRCRRFAAGTFAGC